MSKNTMKANFEKYFPVTMDKILKHEKVELVDYMNLYSASVDFTKAEPLRYQPEYMTGAGNGKIIYEAIAQEFRKFVSGEAMKIAAIVEDDDRLRKYKDTWSNFAFSAHVSNGLFRWVNNHWVARLNDNRHSSQDAAKNQKDEENKRVHDVYTLCMVIWKEEMLVKRTVGVVASAVNLMKRDRDGESGVDESLIKAVVDSLVALGIEYKTPAEEIMAFPEKDTTTDDDGLTEDAKRQLQVYEEYFEEEMLEQTVKYYVKESAAVIEDGDIMAYMRKTEERLVEEAERSRRYLHDVLTNKRLQKAVESAYIEERVELFQDQFRKLLVVERLSDLNLMFKLCSRVERTVGQLREDFRDYVAERGREAIANIPNTEQNDPKTYVETVLQIHDKYQEMVNCAFSGNCGFMEFFGKGCALMVNKNQITQGSKAPGKTSEMLARFVDVMMRKGDSEDFELSVDKAMKFFLYIEDKDVFQKYYNRFLAKRLLMELSLNDDAENSMITRLKTVCGHQYTGTAMKMMQDMNLSKDMSTKFREQKEKSKIKFDANFQVLSTGSWPYNQSVVFNIGRELQNAMDAFTAYYTVTHQGRKLNWLLNASRGELTTHDFARKYTFVASTAQMAVLLKYNQDTRFSFAVLTNDLSMSTDLLSSVLASLVKANVLKKEDEDHYIFNKKFTSKRVKVDLQKLQVAVKDGGEAAKKEQAALEKSLDEDRKMVIQAAIVRIMKMRRLVKHNALITEVVEQVSARFQPRIPMIKKCIDLLMEKQYVQRSNEDKDTYEYIS